MNPISQDVPLPIAAFVGLDWGDQKHVGALSAADEKVECFELPQTADALDEWAAQLRQRFGGRPVAICLEQRKGALAYGLMKYSHLVLYPVNPHQLASFREAMSAGGAKDDPRDADLLLVLVQKHRDRLRPWRPDEPATRLIGQLAEDRRALIGVRTRLSNALKSRLKQYFPLALEVLGELDCELACRFLLRWGSLEELLREDSQEIAAFYRTQHCYHPQLIQARLEKIKLAKPLVTDEAIVESGRRLAQCLARQLLELIEPLAEYEHRLEELMKQHSDAEIFHSFPGAGEALAPRLLAAFGTDRTRWENASQIQAFSGIAPVTRASGQSRCVLRRWACNKYVRQTFHEFALHSLPRSAWAKAYYDQARSRGQKHHAAVRGLAFKWIRILYRCWQNRTRYDEATYFLQLYKKRSSLLQFMAPK